MPFRLGIAPGHGRARRRQWAAGSLPRVIRRTLILLALAAIGLSLSGFGAVTSVVPSQQDVVGDVGLGVTACKVDLAPTVHTGCAFATTNTGEYSDATQSLQLLLAFRVPSGATAPDVVTGTTDVAQQLAFRRSGEYEAELTRLLPPEAGREWIGYLADSHQYVPGAAGSPARQVTIGASLRLPVAADGSPFVGPLQVATILGRRVVSLGARAGRPVTCGDSPFALSGDGTVCVDWPLAAQIGGFGTFATRDFGVLAGKATASPGQTVALPFNVRGAGALPAGLTAALSAAAALPGAGTVTPSVPSAALANGSDTRVTVPVTIPRNAGPGVFDVTLTGRLDNGQTRTGVAKLTVRDRQKPVLSKAKAKPRRFKAATKRKPKRGTNVSFALSEVAKVRLTVERCAKRKRARCVRWKVLRGGLTKPAAQGANTVRFNGRLRGKALKAGAYRLALKPTDAAGNVGKVARVAIAIRG